MNRLSTIRYLSKIAKHISWSAEEGACTFTLQDDRVYTVKVDSTAVVRHNIMSIMLSGIKPVTP